MLFKEYNLVKFIWKEKKRDEEDSGDYNFGEHKEPWPTQSLDT